jgi:hypothetical protein
MIIQMLERINMDNYRFYLLARVQCFKSSEQDLLPCSFYRCTIWSHSRDLDSLHLLRWCHPCSLLAVLKWSTSCENCSILLGVHVHRSRSFTCRILGELTNSSTILFKVCPAHKDKAEIKCMGSVGGKIPT